jgi:hypothetical protein
MSGDSDRELRERFLTLRRETGAGAVDFRAALASARRREHAAQLRRRIGTIALVTTAAVVGLLVARPGRRQAGLVDLASVRWVAPTDFLLETPGAELLRVTPTFTTQGRLVP